jgi:hypothetical protein
MLQEIQAAGEILGLPISRVLRDSWVVAKKHSGRTVLGTVFPLSRDVKERLEKINGKNHRQSA